MKTVLITGASGNLGKAAIDKFSAEGYQIIATVSAKGLGFSVGSNVSMIEVDLTQEEKVLEAITSIGQRQSIDAALLLVGAYVSGTIENTDEQALQKMFNLNFNTAYNASRAVFMQMRQQKEGGRIIFIGSRPALNAKEGKNSLAYGLSKSLIFKLAEYLNAEGSDKNIISHVIVPSTIDTPANRTAMPDANFNHWVKAEAIADAMAYLCSEQGSSLREGVLKLYNRS